MGYVQGTYGILEVMLLSCILYIVAACELLIMQVLPKTVLLVLREYSPSEMIMALVNGTPDKVEYLVSSLSCPPTIKSISIPNIKVTRVSYFTSHNALTHLSILFVTWIHDLGAYDYEFVT
jgi:hypothetical protein